MVSTIERFLRLDTPVLEPPCCLSIARHEFPPPVSFSLVLSRRRLMRLTRRHGDVPALTDISDPNNWRHPKRIGPIAAKWPPRWVDVPPTTSRTEHLRCLCKYFYNYFCSLLPTVFSSAVWSERHVQIKHLYLYIYAYIGI